MKKILCLMIVSILFVTNAYAIVVIYDKTTKEIYSVGNFDDTVVPQGMEKATLPGSMDTYEFAENPTNMKFIDGKFIVNTKKINDAYNAKIAADEKAQEEALITKKAHKMALEALKQEGKAFKHQETE